MSKCRECAFRKEPSVIPRGNIKDKCLKTRKYLSHNDIYGAHVPVNCPIPEYRDAIPRIGCMICGSLLSDPERDDTCPSCRKKGY